MTDHTNGRGFVSDDFDEDEIDWDDDANDDVADGETDGLSPIEAMVGDTEDAVVTSRDRELAGDDEDDSDDEDA